MRVGRALGLRPVVLHGLIPTDRQLGPYKFHSLGHNTGIVGIIMSDHEYPLLVAQSLLNKVLDEFTSKYPRSTWANSDPTLSFPELAQYLAKYQDPQQADNIMKIQKELDETKVILHKTIESVLERGEKIDDLVAKSQGLSDTSRMFYSECRQLGEIFNCANLVNSQGQTTELVLYTDVDGCKWALGPVLAFDSLVNTSLPSPASGVLASSNASEIQASMTFW